MGFEREFVVSIAKDGSIKGADELNEFLRSATGEATITFQLESKPEFSRSWKVAELLAKFREDNRRRHVPARSELTGRARFLAFVEFLTSPRTVENVFKPTIVDIDYEYREALEQHGKGKARLVRLRGYFVLCETIVEHLVESLKNLVVSAWKSAS
ncbi:hypothetical protein ABI59_05225 [Acidobacteria bacterium Mor1]|nr:hypothetical protein ABI59_05225 [Acidobacteria bacterium Mor1]